MFISILSEEATMSTDQFNRQMGQSVGAKLRAARQAKRYTQSKLAWPDFSVSYISAIERGQIHPSLRALEILARRLDLSSTDFLTDKSPDKSAGDAVVNSSLSEEEAIALALVEAQVSILADNPFVAIDLLRELPSMRLSKSQKLQHAFLLGWAYLLTGQLQQSVLSLDEAKKMAVEQKDSYSHIRIHHLLGLAYAAMHNYARALQCHQSCLALLEKAQPADSFFLRYVYSYLGQHYMQMHDSTSAIEMFRQAIAVTEQVNEPTQKQSHYLHMCQHYARAQNYHLAALYAHKYSYLHDQQSSIAVQSELYHYLGQALLKEDQEKARAYLEEALQRNHHTHEPLTRASLTIHLAEWFLVHNELDEAAHLAHEAALLALSDDTLIAVDIRLISGRISYAQKRYDEGNRCFEEGLQMLERLHMYDELSDQSAAYAQLLDERNKPQEAITYYKRAIESRRRRHP